MVYGFSLWYILFLTHNRKSEMKDTLSCLVDFLYHSYCKYKKKLLLFITEFVLNFREVKIFSCSSLEDVKNIKACSFKMSRGIV